MTWREQAACAGTAMSSMFDPCRGAKATPAERQRADFAIATWCNRCPVRTACLDEAVAIGGQGVWGGVLLTHEHGTHNGYWTHRRRGEDACPPCKAACAAYHRERRAENWVR